MDFTKQTQRAAEIHSRFLVTGQATCIDCHKGIAHELPNMEGIEPGWRAPPEFRGETLPQTFQTHELQKALAGQNRRAACRERVSTEYEYPVVTVVFNNKTISQNTETYNI